MRMYASFTLCNLSLMLILPQGLSTPCFFVGFYMFFFCVFFVFLTPHWIYCSCVLLIYPLPRCTWPNGASFVRRIYVDFSQKCFFLWESITLVWLGFVQKIKKIIQKRSDSNQTHCVVVLRLKGQVFRFALADLGRVILIFDSLKRKWNGFLARRRRGVWGYGVQFFANIMGGHTCLKLRNVGEQNCI